MNQNTNTPQVQIDFAMGLASIGDFKQQLLAICQERLNPSGEDAYKQWAARHIFEFQAELDLFEKMVRHHPNLSKVLLKHGRLKYVPFVAATTETDPWWHVRSVGSGSAIRCHLTELPRGTMKSNEFPWEELDEVIADYQPQLAGIDRSVRYWRFETPMAYLFKLAA
jgi:hypothetical protein